MINNGGVRQLSRAAIFTLLMTAGALYSTDDFRLSAWVIFGACAVWMGVSIAASLVISTRATIEPTQGVIFIFLVVSMMLSAILNDAPDLILGALFLGISWLYVSRVVPPGEFDPRVLMIAVWLTFALITGLNLLYPLSFPYRGVFYNPNSLGGFYASMAAAFSAAILIYVRQKKSIINLVWAVGLCVALTLVSNSRLAFASALLSVVLMVSALVALRGLPAKRRVRNGAIAISLLGTAGIIFHQQVVDIFWHKVLVKAGRGDVSGSRMEIWSYIWNEQALTGSGRDALTALDHAAHSTYFSMLAQFGTISAFLLILLIVVAIFQSARRTFTKSFGYSPLILISSFAFLSLAEGMLMKTSMFLFFFALNIRGHRSRHALRGGLFADDYSLSSRRHVHD